MARVNAMLEQVELLLNQRAILAANRYCHLLQLRQHDEKIVQAIKWLQQQSLPQAGNAQPQWLMWLLSFSNPQLLPLTAVAHLAQPEPSWLLLHQLKQQWCQSVIPHWQVAVQQHLDDGAASPFWTLAYYLQLSLDPFAQSQPLTAAALWYLLLAKPAAVHQQLPRYRPVDTQMSLLHQLALQLSSQDYQADLTGYSPQQLVDTLQPHRFGMMLLLASVDDRTQAKLINYLAQTDQHAAIQAMGYSGQLKFVPLLTELAQQQDLNTVASDALAMLLGVIDCEAHLQSPALAQHFHSRSGARHLSGAAQSDLQLDTVWRTGNAQQRQLAACLLKLKATQQPLFAADALQVRA
ncbi:hypothetical protein [Rheinheimera sp.]|uniref:hypothetical protein n=1 Tax=Rheinheimera sp. TaxID=1869214 RepID=UPI004048AD14